MKTPPIYLDHNATTPLDPMVIRAMMLYLEEEFGNPSSPYSLGVRAKEGVEQARKEVAALIGCKSSEVVFTSGGSESNNLALKGLIDLKKSDRFHVITSAVEHPAVLNPLHFLRDLNVNVTILPVDRYGQVDPDDVEKAIKPNTTLISIMLANNETGTLQPIREITKIAKAHGILVHTDAAQAVGKMIVDIQDLGVDLLTIAGHKFYGPKGVGALFIRSGVGITPLIHGANQEGGKRAGTENVILSVGLGAASRVTRTRIKDDIRDLTSLRDRLQTLLFKGIDGLVLNGHPDNRLPNTLNVSVPRVQGAKILELLPMLCASTGAACHDRAVKLSHVLSAMAVPAEIGMGTLRLTVGRGNSMAQIDEAAGLIIEQVEKLRSN